MADVCLVCMPYAPLPRPSLALGLLKAALAREGLGVTVLYPNLWFAERIGLARYRLCSRSRTEIQAGEWTFARAAFGEAAPDPAPYLKECGLHWLLPGSDHLLDGADLAETLLALRDAAGELVEEAARQALATGARIVGCTSTFEQHAASLALLRRVQELDPRAVTLLGGANCEGVMGRATHRAFPWVDYVVSGEADELIGGLCRRILARGRYLPAGELPDGVFGPASRQASRPRLALAGVGDGTGGSAAPRAVVHDLDALPVPDFDAYFAALAGSAVAPAIRPALPFETSRGCWWGAIRHCTFCGLNGASMGYRAKSPGRVLDEIHALEERHGLSDFEAVDNILDMAYFDTVLPRLAEEAEEGSRGGRRRIFYEVKPGLRRAELAALRRAGVVWIQPGIESFSSEALVRIAKGAHGWQNVRFLRWARELGVRLAWQILWDVPGEEDAWYAWMAGLLPALEHLEPPFALARIRFDRFSVYHQRPEAFGLVLKPLRSMAHVYPLPEEELAELTYYFEAEGRPSPLAAPEIAPSDDRPGVRALDAAVAAWQAAFKRRPAPMLRVRDDGATLSVRDTRSCAAEPEVRLSGLERAVYLCCAEGIAEERLPAAVAAIEAAAFDPAAVEAAAGRLVAARLLLRIDGRLLALGLSGPVARLPRRRELPIGAVSLWKMEKSPAATVAPAGPTAIAVVEAR